jgi:hypothetical protein
MMETQVISDGNASEDDRAYDDLLHLMQARFETVTEGGKRPLFTTDATGLFEAYLSALPSANRQYHTCHCCRHFIERFGGLVVIEDDGVARTALWDAVGVPSYYRPGVEAMSRLVRKAAVTGVFLSSETLWGVPESPKNAKHGGAGTWSHFHVTPPRAMVYRSRFDLLTAGQAMAAKREDRGTVARALGEFDLATVSTAVKILRSDALYRSEKVLGAGEWLLKLHEAQANAKGKPARENVLWLAIATAPAGFCHPRSSMIGTLLEDIAAGKGFDDVARSFAAKMHPLQYQRPQAAPTAGAIAAAEKLVEQMGIAPALRRRFARVEEIEALWRPAAESTPVEPSGGVFGHLTPKGKMPARELELPATTMTWEKFQRTVLPEAKRIEFYAPHRGNYVALLTASVSDSPPILQWDRDEQRNPFSLYVWHGGSMASQWKLSSGWTTVTAISSRPSHWHGRVSPNHNEGAIFVLSGARDTRKAGLALFPETLRGELHAVRSVIEAHSRSGDLEGAEEASACGYLADKGRSWDDVRLRVTTGDGRREYRLDRWD